MHQILAHRICRAFIPRGVVKGLLRRENFHKAGRKLVELVRAGYVAVQRRGVKLGENIDPAKARINAVRDRDVHNAVFARQRHGGFGAVLGEGKQAGALPAAHDNTEHLADVQ